MSQLLLIYIEKLYLEKDNQADTYILIKKMIILQD